MTPLGVERIGSRVSFNDLLQTVGDYTDLATVHYFPPNEETAQRNGCLDPEMYGQKHDTAVPTYNNLLCSVSNGNRNRRHHGAVA